MATLKNYILDGGGIKGRVFEPAQPDANIVSYFVRDMYYSPSLASFEMLVDFNLTEKGRGSNYPTGGRWDIRKHLDDTELEIPE